MSTFKPDSLRSRLRLVDGGDTAVDNLDAVLVEVQGQCAGPLAEPLSLRGVDLLVGELEPLARQ